MLRVERNPPEADGQKLEIRNSNLKNSDQMIEPEQLEITKLPFRSFLGFDNSDLFRISIFGFRIFSLFTLLLPLTTSALTPPEAPAPGPDVIIGGLPSLFQAGSNGTQVGLMMATDICNNGNVQVNWFQSPETDHPVIPQNLYRLSGGPNNDERFEQIGQSWVKHAFVPLQQNACGFGCIAAPDSAHLGVGCSTADSASANASQSGLGSRAWVNPFTGLFPSTANNHTGHTHDGTAHRILVEANDLNTALNPGATYYGEAQLVTPHEYAWCAAHPGECNMYNNVSYRQFAVAGTTSFTFSAVGDTVRTTPAIFAWPGATFQTIEPAQGVDGKAFLAYKVTQFGPWEWHYEYAIYNENLDRGIQFFSVPAGCGIGSATNPGFHAPLNHPGTANDGTVGDAGYSNTPWTIQIASSTLSWSTETFAQNPNANALRWGTLYNFRFDGGPPMNGTGTIVFFKTGDFITVSVPGPAPECAPSPTPPPPPTPSPSTSATPTLTPSPSPTPIATPTPSPTPTPSSTSTPSSTPSPSSTPTATPTATPDPCNPIVFREHFDKVIPPALPVSWVASFTPGAANCTPAGTCASGTNWATLSNAPNTPPNCVFHDDPACVTDSILDTPSFYDFSRNQFLSFRHSYDLESGFDGGVLEISINGGPFIDFVEAGGVFQSGGYNGTISTGTQNPIAGRAAWTGNSGGYLTTTARMPAPLSGTQSVVLRFRLATDCSGAGTGWRVDTVESNYVSVSCPPPIKAVNLSTRMRVQTGDSVGIGGFIITGNPSPASSGPSGTPNPPKRVLIRAIGPSLTALGVPGALANPVLELHSSIGIDFNDNWRDIQEAEIKATGIPPSNDLESALLLPLYPGNYTAIVRGNGNPSGVALIEVYDLDQGTNSKLANLSTRAFVSTGDNVVIAGVILGGGDAPGAGERIVVRGLGPSLTASGVPNVLADPSLELRDRNGTLLLANNDWQDNSVQAAILTEAGLAPTNNFEAAMAATLPPDLYTALLAGRNDGAGIGLIEIYDLGP